MELKVLTASEGMILTNGEAFGKSITLGSNDTMLNWWEISDREYEEILKKQMEEGMANGSI